MGENKRVWVDGCFDFFHYGHANALRQATKIGSHLIVGVHSDDSIRINKGIPIMPEEERVEMLKICRYVNEVHENAPFVVDPEVIERKKVDFVVHGSDIVEDSSGNDCYGMVKQMGIFREVERTTGISTSRLLSQILTLHKGGSSTIPVAKRLPFPEDSIYNEELSSKLIDLFSADIRKVNHWNNKGVVYICGFFDLYSLNHAWALKNASKVGGKLLVGIFSDEYTREVRGPSFPILKEKERALCVMSNRYVDEVIMGAPPSVNEDFLKKHSIKWCVMHKELSRYGLFPYYVGSIQSLEEITIIEITTKYDHIDDDFIIKRVSDSQKKGYPKLHEKENKEMVR